MEKGINIDFLRHFTVLDPNEFNHQIDVVGCGAVGSHIIVNLLKLGVKPELVRYWDGDVVASHNIPNQAFHPSDIGKGKAQALQETWGGDAKNVFLVKEEGHNPQVNILFLAVDSMETRKKLIEDFVNLNPSVSLCVETRMGLWGGRIYTMSPSNTEQMKKWFASWYPDEESYEEVTNQEGTACRVGQTLGTTASTIANVAVVQMLRWWRSTKDGETPPPEYEVLLGMTPPDFFVR